MEFMLDMFVSYIGFWIYWDRRWYLMLFTESKLFVAIVVTGITF